MATKTKKEKKSKSGLTKLLEKHKLKGLSQSVGEVMVTMDHSIFKFLDANREIDKSNVASITDSIITFGQIAAPIIVNENYEIIDGQNRWHALNDLNKPVFYYMIPGLTIDHVHIFQTGRPWKVKDWLRLHIKSGNKHYMVYDKFRSKYKLGHLHTMNLLYGYELPKNMNQDRLWRRGEFEVKYLDDATKFMDKVEMMRPHLSEDIFYDNKRTKGIKRDLIYALEQVMEIKEFDFNRFIMNMQIGDAPPIQCWGTKEGYAKNILDVHNHNLPDSRKVKLT